MLTIDRANTLIASEHDEFVIRYRRLLPDGSPSPLLGEVYALVVFGPGVEARTAVGEAGADLDGAWQEMRFAPDIGAALAGKVSLQWKLVEVLPGGGEDTRFTGRVKVVRSAAAAATPPVTGDGEILMVIDEDRPGARVRTSSRGARGLASYEARFLAGRIAEPTEAAEDAYLRALAAGLGDNTIVGGGLAQGSGTIGGTPTVTVTAATEAEAITGSRIDRAVTPKALKAALLDSAGAVLDYTEALEVRTTGLLTGGGRIGDDPTLTVEAASDEDAIDGTSATKAMTPKATKAALDPVTDAIAKRVRLDAPQDASLAEKAMGRSNLGLGGRLLAGVWTGVPTMSRLLLVGTGTVTIDARDSLGAITAAGLTYTINAATNEIAFPFFGAAAVEVRATYTGTASAEII